MAWLDVRPGPTRGRLRAAERSELVDLAETFRLVLTGRTRRPALRIALIVGTLLTLFYQGEVLFIGDLDAETVARIVFNSCLPCIVSSIGFLVGCRVPRQ